MSHNSFGHLFRVTTWGESHGPAIGCVVDGCPPGIRLEESYIQARLDQRRPGTSKFVTQRQEPDQVKILSGVFEDDRTDGPRTTGTPISLMIENVDQRSKDYSDIRDKYRPGHADYTYDAKYGFRDYRGGGRSSARETAMRVAAGAVAERVLEELYQDTVKIEAAMIGMGPHTIDPARADWSTVGDNPFWCPDPEAAQHWALRLEEARKDGNSLGALIEVRASGVPAGLGAPIYGKMDSDLAAAMMTINASKGVEIGAGFGASRLSGTENADGMKPDGNGGVMFDPQGPENTNGGILGGITSGQDIVVRLAIKPTSSILTPRKSVTRDGEETEVVTKGRHDPCVGIRGVPVARAMMALVLADHALRHRAQTGLLRPA
ncbi:chorismate synthase [Parvularcula marina]|uniref:Chorismate synthase n=1 Tax=Parvularcula marina TaxID=2292771 RepID=A0A371RKX9_9PROT|nr:chorismate synthase [Parvularcula marina]RFB06113.1 chorismate synthase [Parvularcula marina]